MDMNHAVICLLPKQKQPEAISQFRPICLSNVVAKIVNKVIANRVKVIIGDLIGEWQTSFIPGWQAIDNIVVTQELVHSLHRKKGERGALIAKIDLEKTYVRVKWKFL